MVSFGSGEMISVPSCIFSKNGHTAWGPGFFCEFESSVRAVTPAILNDFSSLSLSPDVMALV